MIKAQTVPVSLVRVWKNYRMKAEITKRAEGRKGLRLTVNVKFPSMSIGVVTISADIREMQFEYNPDVGRFIDVANGLDGGYLQYQNQQGDLFELDSFGDLKAVEG